MHLGTFAQIGSVGPRNLKHIVINNGAHDSVGGQHTAAANDKFSFPGVALACGYRTVSVLLTAARRFAEKNQTWASVRSTC